MFRHPIPLNTLCHHQANIAYDKLAVISDHIDELANVADCILDLKEYLFHILKLYVTLAKDETITGKKKFTKPITTTRVNLYNEVDETDNIAFIETGWDNCIPYVDLHVDREDSQSHDQYKANIRLLLDPCDNYKAKFLIPYTDGEEDYSAVCVKYLEEQWQILKDLIDALTDRMSAVEGAIVGLGGHLNSALNYPVDNSNELVTSDGIYEYGQTVKQELLNAISTAVAGVPDTNTTYSFTLSGSNLIITPSSGNAQTVDLSPLVSGGNSSNNDSPGSVEAEGTYAGYRIWRSGNLAVVFVPGGDNLYNQAAISKPLPFAMEPITISSHVMGSSYIGAGYITGTYQGNGTYTIHLIENGTKLEISYTGGGNSPGTGEFPATTIIGWVI